METETVAARNVVDMLLREEFNASICPPGADHLNATPDLGANFVYGWDC